MPNSCVSEPSTTAESSTSRSTTARPSSSYRRTIEDGLPTRDNRGRGAVGERAEGSRVVWESSFEPLDTATAR